MTEEEFMADRFSSVVPPRIKQKRLQFWHRKSKRDEEERKAEEAAAAAKRREELAKGLPIYKNWYDEGFVT